MIRPIRAACALLLFVLAGCQQSTGVPRDPGNAPDILLFNGNGTSRNGVSVLQALLANGFRYDTIDSPHLDALPDARLREYRLFIVPGGNFEVLGQGLKRETVARVRAAVLAGLNYHGICAGAFFAGDSRREF